MTQKITIQELVSKYTFEVDEKGAKAYEDRLKQGEKVAEKAADGETQARRKAAAEIKRVQDRSARSQRDAQKRAAVGAEKSAKRAERAKTRSLRRETKAVGAATASEVKARAVASAATARGDNVAAARAMQSVRRAERAKLAAVRRGAQQRERAERRAARATERVWRRASRTVRREARKTAREVRKVNQASRGGSGRAANAKKFAGALGGIAKGATVAAAAMSLLAGATFSFVNSQTAALDVIAKQSKQVGLGAEEYQRLNFAAERSGTSIAGVGTASKKLQSQMLDVAGGGGKALTDALGEVGLKASDIEGKNFEEQLSIISDAMNNTATDTEKVGIAAKIFGLRAGPDLIPLLNEGSEGIKALGDAAGNVFSADELKPAEEFQDRLVDLKTEIKQVAGRIALELVPIVEKTVTQFRSWVEENQPLIQKQLPRLVEFLSLFSRAAFAVIDAILSLVGGIDDLSTALETLALAFVAVKLAMAGPAGMVVAAALAGAAIGNLMNAFGASDALANFVGDITGLNEALAALDKTAGGVTKKRGAPKLPGGGEAGTPEGLVEFSKGGKSVFIDESTLLDIAVGDTDSDALSQDEALNIVSQMDQKKDPGRQARAEQKGKAAAAKGGRGKKKGKGKKRQATGLEAQIDQQFKQLSDQSELRASAEALQGGATSQDAFAAGREAAKATDSRLRQNFAETGELPVGIARDLDQLANSPAVEEGIGRVPPPVISVKNDVTNLNFQNSEFTTVIEAALNGIGPQELADVNVSAMARFVAGEISTAIQNLKPPMRV